MDYISGWCESQKRLDGYTAIVTGSNTGLGKETAKDFYLRADVGCSQGTITTPDIKGRQAVKHLSPKGLAPHTLHQYMEDVFYYTTVFTIGGCGNPHQFVSGARIIMACRDLTKANAAKKDIEQETREETGRGILVVEQLDLASLKSVREFAFRILEHERSINILVNNAGVMCCPEGKTEDGFETHMGTNHFGHALLTLLLLPRLTKSAPARIVCVSSLLHTIGSLDFKEKNFQKSPYNALNAYSVSKAANLIFAKALAEKLKEHNISDVTTYSLHPGVIGTDLGRHFSSTLGYGTTWLFQNVLSWFVKSPRCGAQTSIYCAIDEACANQSGLYYADCAVASTSRHCGEKDVAAELWEHTVALLNLGSYNPFGGVDPDRNSLQ